MDNRSNPSTGNTAAPLAYSGYYKTAVPQPDPHLSQTGPGTPLGEYFRRFWQPVCMTEQLTDVPHPVRILGEDLVVYRDKEGTIGVLHRHCVHRGASLEYGIIQQKGIRCAYHAIHFAEDGQILSAPGEKDNGARICTRLAQGAYPAIERDGLVFAYMGPPEHKPEFPEYDAYQKVDGLELVPFSNVFPCNWLQTIDNIADQMHTSFLHNPEFLFEGKVPEDIDWKTFALTYFASVPYMDYVPIRGGTAMAFIASRRVSEDLVWVRINDLIVPNVSQHASLYEDGAERRLFHRVAMSRWYVPVDDTHSIIYGWRMFGDVIDPKGKGNKEKVGWDKMDFLDGQVGDRTYEEGQRLPGDWEIITSQRPIAVHALENPIESDVGVYLFRKLVREASSGKNDAASADNMNARANAGEQNYCYTQNTVLRIPARSSEEQERDVLRKVGRRIIDICAEADRLTPAERKQFIVARIEQLEKEASDL